MRDINSLENLIEDLEEILDTIFLVGINSIDSRAIDELIKLSKECNNFGLAFAESSTKEIAKELESIKGNFEMDKSSCVNRVCTLNQYITILKSQIFKGIEGEKFDEEIL